MGHYERRMQHADGGPHAEYVRVWVKDPWDDFKKLPKEEQERRIAYDREVYALWKKRNPGNSVPEEQDMDFWEKHAYNQKKHAEQVKKDFDGDMTDYVRQAVLNSFKYNRVGFDLVDRTHFRHRDGVEVVAYANFALLEKEFKEMGYKVTFNLAEDDGWGKYTFCVHPHDVYWHRCNDKIVYLEGQLNTAHTEAERRELENELKEVKAYKDKCY